MSVNDTNIVVCACIHKEGKIFIARRAATKAFLPGSFEFLGGHLEHGEQPTEALKRELKEELQIEVNVGQLVDAFTYNDRGVTKLELVYLCTLKDPTILPTLNPDDHSESLWIGQGEQDKFEKQDEETEILKKAFSLLGERK